MGKGTDFPPKEVKKVCATHLFLTDLKKILENKNFNKEKKVLEFLNIIDKHESVFIELDEFFFLV